MIFLIVPRLLFHKVSKAGRISLIHIEVDPRTGAGTQLVIFTSNSEHMVDGLSNLRN